VEEYPPAVVVPSGAEAVGEASEPQTIGDRIEVAGSPEWRSVGELFHGFLAADDRNSPPAERLEMANGLLERWGLTDEIRPEDVVASGDRMHTWIEATWPGATWHREWPLLHRLPSRSEAHGSADLVLELEDTFILIDHKTFPGGAERARKAAAGYGGQLKMYANAIEAATGKSLAGAFIHLPVGGMVVLVEHLDSNYPRHHDVPG
jgi:ATP-dependent exoDNAse (exonuclease V) beta subunit